MRYGVFLAVSGVFCYVNNGIKIKIVSKEDPELYVAFSGKFARLMTKGKIKDSKGCSKFVIEGDETTILQRDMHLCQKTEESGVIPCDVRDENSVWKVVPSGEGKFVRFVLASSGECLKKSEVSDTLGGVMDVGECDDTDEFLFKIKRVVAKKTKKW